MAVRVLLADDQELVRAALRVLVESAPDLEVVGEAADGAAAVALAAETPTDVILMDIRMPGLDGIEATRQIVSTRPGERPRVIVLTTFGTDEYVYEALRAGASGFLLKDAGPARLFDAIRVVDKGDALLDPSVTRRLIAQFTSRPEVRRAHPAELEGLTEREREVLTLVAEGLSNDEIAERLAVSLSTAKKHVSNVMMKLQARDRAQLVVIAYESGLVLAGAGE
jgi:DNA-binding NarL/FixJ family response regulator